jgi:hypothetical protein
MKNHSERLHKIMDFQFENKFLFISLVIKTKLTPLLKLSSIV